MSCCADAKNQTLYAAVTPSGSAVACKKCGRARPATTQEAAADHAVSEGAA